jgi:oligopeptidase B
MALKKIIIICVCLVSSIILVKHQLNKNIIMIQAPIAQKVPMVTEVNGQQIQDDYSWLRDKNYPKVDDQKIIKYLQEENSYANQAFFDKFKEQKNILFEEQKARIQLNDKSSETKKDNYYYYERTFEDKEYPIYYRRLGLNGQEKILLDVNELALGKKYIKIGAISISPDQKLLAYSVDYQGNEHFTIKVINLQDGIELSNKIDNTIGQIVWHEKLDGFFYTPLDKNWRAMKVFFHYLDQKLPDQLILEEKNPLYSLRVSKSSSKKYLFIQTSGHQENQFHILDFARSNNLKGNFKPQLFEAMSEKIFYDIDHNGNNFYILTNDESSDFRLAITNINHTGRKNWRSYIPGKKDEYLASFDLTNKYLILNYKIQGLPAIRIFSLKDKDFKAVDFPDQAYSATAYSTNFEEDDIRVSYSSLARPDTIYQYNYTQGSLDIIKVREVPSGFNPDDYQVRRLWSDNDGVKVPYTILFKKSLMKQDGLNPLYLYGYGSYGVSVPLNFRSSILSLVDRGFVFAIAHIRGGDDLGYKWYEDAKFLNKKRTFQDFIAVAQDLIVQKYTKAGNIVISGGSAGGLLIGSAINSHPELFKAAIAHVPFVDVLNTMLDDTLPLTPGEYKEWGDPKQKQYFEYIKSYSPYDNIKKQNYPNLFVTGSISDPRVGYFEPAKWVAKLRDNKTDNNLLLFKTNMDAGHSGSSGRFDYLKEIADDHVFILSVFDIKI